MSINSVIQEVCMNKRILCFFVIIMCGFGVYNLTAMDTRQQALDSLVEECLNTSHMVPDYIKNQIDALKLSIIELRSFYDRVQANKPDCVALISFLKSSIEFEELLESATYRGGPVRSLSHDDEYNSDGDSSELDPQVLNEIRSVRNVLLSATPENHRQAYRHLRGLVMQQSGFLS